MVSSHAIKTGVSLRPFLKHASVPLFGKSTARGAGTLFRTGLVGEARTTVAAIKPRATAVSFIPLVGMVVGRKGYSSCKSLRNML